ncbi:butyrophilin subfamily 2 member A2-like [Echeneis naucrates]|uniref:butyrophilin subfamily 2 member A2-like n=1 Tax=Echeneis naucrates TaxID=173247 RepID=UPI0011135500|nr:butyrophilin subfamily 2 member A2-like [Echeneis naucrates]
MNRTALFLIRTLLLAAAALRAAGQNDVICPPQPIQTEEGETVSIRCRLNQTVDLQDEMISVSRPNLNEEVISYRDGKDHSEDNADSIRFSLNHEDLKGGILNLQISSVQLSDRGLYTVYIRGRNVPFNVTLDVVKKSSADHQDPHHPNRSRSREGGCSCCGWRCSWCCCCSCVHYYWSPVEMWKNQDV